MRKQWRSLLGAVVGVGFLAWALHGISFEEVWLHIRHANPWYLLGSCVAGTLIFPLRAPRWRVILSPVAEKLPASPVTLELEEMTSNDRPIR